MSEILGRWDQNAAQSSARCSLVARLLHAEVFGLVSKSDKITLMTTARNTTPKLGNWPASQEMRHHCEPKRLGFI